MSAAEAFFSPDYATARKRFVESARRAGLDAHSLVVEGRTPDGSPLSTDIAWLGELQAQQVLLVSSGLHGVEGFAGSAVQSALLADPPALPAGSALVMAHALNPWGMAWLRRTDEANVDLNRNFLPPGEAYAGAPEDYRRLDRFLNPPSPPAADGFYLRAVGLVLRHGYRRLQQAIACGQYEYPRGLFYGGSAARPSTVSLLDWVRGHLAGARRVLVLDLHTGLGPRGRLSLLGEPWLDPAEGNRLEAALGTAIWRAQGGDSSGYVVRGGLGDGLVAALPGVRLDFFTCEFGTRTASAMLHALREENRWHHYGGGPSADHPARRRLLEAANPNDRMWQRHVVDAGVTLVRRALAAGLDPMAG